MPLDRIRRLPGVARANTGAGEQAKSSTGGSAVAVPRCQQRAHGRAQQCADDSATGHLSVGGIHRVGATDLLFGILLAGGLILLEHVEGFVGRRHYRNARAQWLGHASAKQKDDRKPQILCFDEIHMGSLLLRRRRNGPPANTKLGQIEVMAPQVCTIIFKLRHFPIFSWLRIYCVLPSRYPKQLKSKLEPRPKSLF